MSGRANSWHHDPSFCNAVALISVCLCPLDSHGRNACLALLCSIAASFLTAPVQADDAVSEKRIRDAIQKSIPYIERDGEKWIKVKKCNSCHMIPFMLWSLHEAELRRFKVNSKRLIELDNWSVTAIMPKKDRKAPPKGSETQA